MTHFIVDVFTSYHNGTTFYHYPMQNPDSSTFPIFLNFHTSVAAFPPQMLGYPPMEFSPVPPPISPFGPAPLGMPYFDPRAVDPQFLGQEMMPVAPLYPPYSV